MRCRCAALRCAVLRIVTRHAALLLLHGRKLAVTQRSRSSTRSHIWSSCSRAVKQQPRRFRMLMEAARSLCVRPCAACACRRQQPAWRHTNALAAGLVAASYEYTTLAMNLVHAMAPRSMRSHEHEVWAWACIALRGGHVSVVGTRSLSVSPIGCRWRLFRD